MAKKEETIKVVDKKKVLASLLNDLRKELNSTNFTNSKFSVVTDFISTGDYGLNRIISGSIYGGVPAGRVIVFGGEEQSGKTLIVATIIANALKNGDYDHIFFLDSEGGALKSMFESLGCNTDCIEHVLLESIEDASVKVNVVLDRIKVALAECPSLKFLCVMDSLGALMDSKYASNAIEKSKVVIDMGSKAKSINNMVKSLTIPCLVTNTPFLIINHIYDNPGAMFSSKILNQAGGRAAKYMARITIQCSRLFTKEDENGKKQEDNEGGSFYNASKMRFFTVKNSLIKPFIETELYLDFGKGMSAFKYYSILEPAMRYGFIKPGKQSGRYIVPSWSTEKTLSGKELLTHNEAWNSFLKEFDERSKADLSYGGNRQEIEKAIADGEIDDDESDLVTIKDSANAENAKSE